jgi:hypothetical protein
MDRTELIGLLNTMREKAEPVGWVTLIEYELLIEIIKHLTQTDDE